MGALFLAVAVYGLGRLLHVAQGSLYHGVRSPYLQMHSPTAVTLRWQSINSYRGYVHYGLSPDKLDQQAIDTEVRAGHEVRLQGLLPYTKYYYAVGTRHMALPENRDNWFMTAPEPGAVQGVRFWILGDPGRAIPDQAQVTQAALGWMQANPRPGRPNLDLMLTTGDNAYSSGKNEEFQQNFFKPYEAVLRNYPVWPVYGNHDARRWSFFEVFSLPTGGESGGVASGTEHYYSFDYGQVHFVVLDSQASRWNNNREMVDWLSRDLKANPLPWVIGLFHHPAYTKGSHNSDSEYDSRGRMFEMRQNVLPVLEQLGVDLVLAGHSHGYERSYLIDCHYGTSNTVKDEMFLSRDKQHYQKRSPAQGSHEGTIYAVVGSSARADHGPMNHPVMAKSLMETGSLVVDISGNRLDGYFVGGSGEVLDRFTINKGVDEAPVGVCNP